MKTLLQRFIDAKIEFDHHESDLYVFVTPKSTKIIEEWCKENKYNKNWHCPIFKSQTDGKKMYDCAFQYYKI